MKTYEAALGKWRSILSILGVEDRHLVGKACPCPICGGRDRFTFDDRDGCGTWICRNCGAGVGLDLVMALKGVTYAEACRQVDQIVGRAVYVPAPKAEADPMPRLRRIDAEKKPVSQCVRDYLASRGLSVPPRSVWSHPGQVYYADGKAMGTFEAMCAKFVGPDGAPRTWHLTYLQNGRKAPVTPSRKILPPASPMAGGAIRLFDADDTLAIAEGVETALAFHALTGIPTWAATSATLLAKFEPPAGIRTVHIAGDNDESAVGQAAAWSLAKTLIAKGIKAKVCIPDQGDWADVLTDTVRREVA